MSYLIANLTQLNAKMRHTDAKMPYLSAKMSYTDSKIPYLSAKMLYIGIILRQISKMKAIYTFIISSYFSGIYFYKVQNEKETIANGKIIIQ